VVENKKPGQTARGWLKGPGNFRLVQLQDFVEHRRRPELCYSRRRNHLKNFKEHHALDLLVA
jgi:hypothetical protein